MTSNPNPAAIVVDKSVTRDTVTQHLSNAGFLVASTEGSDAGIQVVTFRRGETDIGLVEDGTFGVRYLSARGPEAEQLLAEAVRGLATISLEQAKAQLTAGASVHDAVHALGMIAIAASRQYDAETFALVGWHLMHPMRELQLAAILATTYLGWPDFIEPLDQLSRSVPDAEIAAHARLAAQYIQSEQAQ